MNLREEILFEHSRKQTDRIVKWVGSNEKKFAELMNLFLKGEYRVTQRAAWSVCLCIEKKPLLAKPWLRKMILKTQEKNIHDAVKRNVLKIFSEIEIPKTLYGIVANSCFGFLMNAGEPIAVRVHAMTVLTKIAQVETALKNELRIIVEDLIYHESAGIKARGKKLLKELNKR